MKRAVLFSTVFCLFLTISITTGYAADKAASRPALKKLTVMLDWFINPDFAPLIIAREKGFFASHGLDVEIIEPADPNDPPKLAAAGKVDIAVTSQPLQLLHIDNGLPLVRIATLVAVPLNTVMVMADSGIEDLKQLAGKKVGYSIGGFESLLLNTMLRESGLGADDVETVNGVPVYDELILVSNKKHIADREQAALLRHFVDALAEGTRYLVKHQQESWQLFIKTRPQDLDNELNRRAWHDFLPLFALRPAALDRARYLRLAQFFKENGMIKEVPPLDDFAVELP